ncbi:hypothetical protein HanIR_Chr15g0772461 [Helianthus annuus]|nr:hypothetical protein HanIR_Chr15g0772461 [Helianthus annuus]
MNKLMRPQPIGPATTIISSHNPTPLPLRPTYAPPPHPEPYQHRSRSPKHTCCDNNRQIPFTQTTTAANRLTTKSFVSIKTRRIKIRQA